MKLQGFEIKHILSEKEKKILYSIIEYKGKCTGQTCSLCVMNASSINKDACLPVFIYKFKNGIDSFRKQDNSYLESKMILAKTILDYKERFQEELEI